MTKLNQGLNRLLHSLLPTALRTSLKPNTAAYIHARALTVMLLMISGLLAIYLLLMAGLDLAFDRSLHVRDVWLLLLFGLHLGQTLLFYRFKNYWISGLAFTNCYFIVVIVVLIINGGYDSPGITILLSTPMISFFIGSRQEGIQHACIAIVYYWILVSLKLIDFNLPDIFDRHDHHMIFMMNWLFTLVVIALTLVVYEAELGNGESRRIEQVKLANHLDYDMHGMRAISRQVQNRLHLLLPGVLRNSLVPGSTNYTRAIILVILLPATTLLSIMAAMLIIGVDLSLHAAQLQYDIAILGVAPCFALQTWGFYHYANPRLSGAILGYFVFIIIVLVVWLTGGYASPLLVMLLICPVGFFMTNGNRAGIISACVIALIGILFDYADYLGIKFADFFHDAAQPITAGIGWMITVTAMMVCMMAYDSRLEKL